MSVNCCNRSWDLGCISCATGFLELPITARETGTHTANYRYLGTIICIEFEAIEGDVMNLPTRGINENFTHYVYITGPDGERLTYSADDGLEYDCFRLRTDPRRTGPAAPEPSAGDGCPFVVNVYLNGVLKETTAALDSCVDEDINVTLTLP